MNAPSLKGLICIATIISILFGIFTFCCSHRTPETQWEGEEYTREFHPIAGGSGKLLVTVESMPVPRSNKIFPSSLIIFCLSLLVFLAIFLVLGSKWDLL